MKDKKVSNGFVAIAMIALIVLSACATPAAAPVPTPVPPPTVVWSALWQAYTQGDEAAANLLVQEMGAPQEGKIELVSTEEATYIVELELETELIGDDLLPLKTSLGPDLYLLNSLRSHWFPEGQVKGLIKIEGIGSPETNLQIGNLLEVN